jgi:hypothetical protein
VADVAVWRSNEFANAHFKGLATCGSVWACAVCASKIQERRRGEVEQAMTWAESNELVAIMVTLTFPHQSFHQLRELLAKQAEALGRFRRSRTYARAVKRIGFAGLIRSLEVTHGDNGWHPHTHELWFVQPDQMCGLFDELLHAWEHACRASGLLPHDKTEAFRLHALDIRADVTSGEYLAKQDDSRRWGMSDEISKATSKAGRKAGVHPHHFLVRRAQGDEGRYLEYVDGMKGRRQLFWSHGLKAIVGVTDATDEQLADAPEARAVHVYTLPNGAWNVVRGNDARAELLDAIEEAGPDGAVHLLRSLGFEDGESHAHRNAVRGIPAEGQFVALPSGGDGSWRRCQQSRDAACDGMVSLP